MMLLHDTIGQFRDAAPLRHSFAPIESLVRDTPEIDRSWRRGNYLPPNRQEPAKIDLIRDPVKILGDPGTTNQNCSPPSLK